MANLASIRCSSFFPSSTSRWECQDQSPRINEWMDPAITKIAINPHPQNNASATLGADPKKYETAADKQVHNKEIISFGRYPSPKNAK